MDLLVVDDSTLARDLLASQLTRRGHDVRVAATADEALMLLHLQKADVVLLDVMLPDERESKRVVDAINKAPEWHDVKIVITTGADDAVYSSWPGVYAMLTKVFNVEDVIAILKKMQREHSERA